jgi:outer membrane protein
MGVLAQSKAQDGSKWDLRSCIEYAIQHNISVQQADVQARLSKLQADLAKNNQLPNLSGSTGMGMRLGRSIDPTTNGFTNTQFLFNNFGLNGGVQLFNAGKLRNNAAATNYTWQASLADFQTATNDISLNVATYYLQVLSAIEQSEIAKIQIGQTKEQLSATKKRVDVGLLPELNALELETQLANDSSSYISAISSIEQSKLSLKALLNLDASVPFEIVYQSVDKIKLQGFGELQPDDVFAIASQQLPNVKAANFRVKAADKNLAAAKANFYPSLSFGYSLSTNFSNSFKYISGYDFGGYTTPGASTPFVNVNGSKYYIQSPVFTPAMSSRNFGTVWNGWSDQMNNNFGQSFGLQLSIPIFNNGLYKTSYQQAKLNLRSANLQEENVQKKLKQDIFSAYTNAIVALNKMNATLKALQSSEKTFEFAQKRYDLGLLGTIELLNNQNNYLKAKVNFKSAQYEYVFRLKLLEFYKGINLELY